MVVIINLINLETHRYLSAWKVIVLFTSYNFAYIRPKTIDKGVVLTVVS